MKRPCTLLLIVSLAGCVGAGDRDLAAVEPTGDVLSDTAALLVAAESARNKRERAPLVDRLNTMNVALMDGATDDPLSEWRAQYQPSSATPFRGRTLGPAYRRARLEAGESVRIEQIFYAGERADIAAQASSGSNVALEISNPREEAICARPLAPRANCSWLPIFTERFSIELENRGTEATSIYLVFR
ncbi:hypothetical protein GCM10009127_09360 [Alteraurantiacibacter aestuarii]|uniref:Lipoprotein n=1 Tax=Alteraurantiacibacter aestuarii TaxID=650004 RepID=A0A844ZIC9_9SPHN|nr:hypothetical protein [Alteraurantiacibacter aestuarii]MXO87324.1 hypothetical protein [Alteraurantiacibacter aestuarii]